MLINPAIDHSTFTVDYDERTGKVSKVIRCGFDVTDIMNTAVLSDITKELVAWRTGKYALKSDKLEDMLATQKQFEHSLGYSIDDMSNQERAAYIKEYTLHCEHELHEMLQEIPYFKPWKKYTGRENLLLARKEFIDAWHFFMNIMLALGFDADVLFNMYQDKHVTNEDRQADKEHYKPCIESKVTNETSSPR